MAIPDDVLNTVAAEFGLDSPTEGETWEDRISDAAFTSPSGLRVTFDYEDLRTIKKKKTTSFLFPDASGALVQDFGVGDHEFPIRMFLSGPDCDRQAAVLEAALSEAGIGVFESPIHGTHNVVAFGDITRRDDLVSAANQVVFEVSFLKSIDLIYPIGADDPASATFTALELYGDAADADFATSLSMASVAEQQGVIDNVLSIVDKVGATMKSIAAVQDSVADSFQDIVDTVKNTMEVLIGQPLSLAISTRQLITEPSRALASINARLESYRGLADDVFLASDSVSEPGGPGNLGPEFDSRTGVGNDSQEPNKFHVRNLAIGSYIAGSIQSVLYTDTETASSAAVNSVNRQRSDAILSGVTGGANRFETASQALSAASQLLTLWDTYVAWRDENYKNISGGNLTETQQRNFISAPSNVDQGASYFRLMAAVSAAASFLVSLSYGLRKERSIVLDRSRAVVELAYRLYQSIDDAVIDFVIASNGLELEQILDVPKGRRIVYYV